MLINNERVYADKLFFPFHYKTHVVGIWGYMYRLYSTNQHLQVPITEGSVTDCG